MEMKLGQSRAIGPVRIADCILRLGLLGAVLLGAASTVHAERVGRSSNWGTAEGGVQNDPDRDVHDYTGKVQRMSPEMIVIERDGEILELHRNEIESPLDETISVGDQVEVRHTLEGRMLRLHKVPETKEKKQRAGEKGQERELDDSAHYFAEKKSDTKRSKRG